MAKPFKSQFDLIAEAYGKVNYSKQRVINEHSSARKVRGYEPKLLTEAHCDEEDTLESVELGGDLYEVGAPDPSNESELIISIVKHANGYMITTGQFSSPEDFVTKGPDSAIEAGGYALTLDGKLMAKDDLKDGLGHEDNERAEGAAYMAPEGMGPGEDAEQREGATNEFPDGEGKYEVASVGGMHGQSIMGGKKFNSLQAACIAAGANIEDCYEDVDGWIDMQGDGKTLEFVVDEDTAIVMHKNVPA